MTVALNVRRALLADVDAIFAIAHVSDGAPQWSDAVWKLLLTEQDGTNPARACFLAEGRRGPLGFVVVSCTSGVGELESVAVNSTARRKGIGRLLCREAMTWARGKETQVMELEVRASSFGAIALYRGLGFMEQGRRPQYYREPTEDAVLMWADLTRELP